jgi:hypothetical protein
MVNWYDMKDMPISVRNKHNVLVRYKGEFDRWVYYIAYMGQFGDWWVNTDLGHYLICDVRCGRGHEIAQIKPEQWADLDLDAY